MKTFKYKFLDETADLSFWVTTYNSTGNMAIIMVDPKEEEEFGDLTVNLDFLAPGYAFVDTNNNSGAVKMLKKYKFAKPTGTYMSSGYTNYPLYEFDFEMMKDYIVPESDYFMCKAKPDEGHYCKYCGELTEGDDPDELCNDCKETFGHMYFSEL